MSVMNEPKKPLPSAAPLEPRRNDAPRGESGVLPSGGPEGGFSAMLQHAGLWDLVQLRCESRVRCVVCVTSGRQVGYLYFAEGQIVHAAAGGIQGERAVLEILSWTSGTWDACDRPWPTVPSITTSWQGLFLRAAQQQDEARRAATSSEDAPQRKSQPQVIAPVRLSSVPPSQPTAPPRLATVVQTPVLQAPVPRALQAPAPRATQAPAPQVTQALAPPVRALREESGVSYRPEDFEHAVRMDAQGAIVSGHGAIEDHAELAAYCCRLGDLLGELLGMGKLQAIEASSRGYKRCFVVREASGDTVVLRPRSEVDPAKVRLQLNLS
jgi:hypothetical protein